MANFPAAFARSNGFMEQYQLDGYRGWLGTVMLVDYEVCLNDSSRHHGFRLPHSCTQRIAYRLLAAGLVKCC